jgi:hypothetical protein
VKVSENKLLRDRDRPYKNNRTKGQNVHHDFHYINTHSSEKVPVDIHKTGQRYDRPVHRYGLQESPYLEQTTGTGGSFSAVVENYVVLVRKTNNNKGKSKLVPVLNQLSTMPKRV